MTEVATDNVSQALGIISAAQRQADDHISEAKVMSAEIVRDGRTTRRELVALAQTEADKVLSEARADAEQIRADAIRSAATIAAQAAAEAPAQLRSELARLREQKEALTAHVDMIRTMTRTFAESVIAGLDEWTRRTNGI